MAGGFAHVLAARQAIEDFTRDDAASRDLQRAALMNRAHVEVGSVAPDYPYLRLSFGDQGRWADAMHYTTTGEPIRAAVAFLRTLDAEGGTWGRSVAWLMGYVAHVATDLTIHPVVEAIVGPYEQNKARHRICEMNQDAYVWQFANTGEIGAADMFKTAIGYASAPDGTLDPDVTALWTHMLRESYPDLWAGLPPEIDGWYSGYRTVIDLIDESRQLPAFGRHILKSFGSAYPRLEEVDPQFIRGIPTPDGVQDYDAVFARAVRSIVDAWTDLAAALAAPAAGPVILASLPDANLDTGRTADGTFVTWGMA